MDRAEDRKAAVAWFVYGSLQKAADALGIKRQTLYSRARRWYARQSRLLGVPPPPPAPLPARPRSKNFSDTIDV